jgi:hypothetical protein
VQPVPSTYAMPAPQEQVLPCLLSPLAATVAALSVHLASAVCPTEAIRAAFWLQALAGLAQALMSASKQKGGRKVVQVVATVVLEQASLRLHQTLNLGIIMYWSRGTQTAQSTQQLEASRGTKTVACTTVVWLLPAGSVTPPVQPTPSA